MEEEIYMIQKFKFRLVLGEINYTIIFVFGFSVDLDAMLSLNFPGRCSDILNQGNLVYSSPSI